MIIRLLVLLMFLLLSGCTAPLNAPTADASRQAEVHYKLALAHLQSNDPTSALEELLTAEPLDPANAAIQAALGQSYQAKKAWLLAEQHYLKALKLSDDNPRYQNNIADLYLKMEQWGKAIDYFDRAASNLLFHNAQVALTGKGYAQYRNSDYHAALISYSEAIELAPAYAPAYFYQALVYRALEQPQAEQTALQRALTIAPEFHEARYRLAELLQAEGQLMESRKQFLQLKKGAAGSFWATRAAKQLRLLPAP